MKTTLRPDYVTEMFSTIAQAQSDSYTKLFKNAAIWLEKPIRTSRETKRRICSQDEICIFNGKLIDCEDKPTHVIIDTYGTLQDNILEIECKDLSTGEVIRVRL